MVLDTFLTIISTALAVEQAVAPKVKDFIDKKTATPAIQLTGKIKRDTNYADILANEETFDLSGEMDLDSLEEYDAITVNIKNMGNRAVSKVGINAILVYAASEEGFKMDVDSGYIENYLLFKDTSECEHNQREISLRPGEEKSINLVFSPDDFNEDVDNGEIGESVFVCLSLTIYTDNGVYEQDMVSCTYENLQAYKAHSGEVVKKG